MAYTAKYSSDTGAGANDGSSEANAWTWAQMITAVNALGGGAGIHVKHKSNGGSARTTANDTFTVGGSSTSPLIIEGYLSTSGAAGALGDGYLGRTNGHCCGGNLITTNMPTITYSTGRLTLSTWTILQGFKFASQNTGAAIVTGADCLVSRCVSSNSATNTAATAFTAAARAKFFDCDGTLSGGSGAAAFSLANAGATAIGCRAKGGPGEGFRLASTGTNLFGSLAYGGATGVAVTNTAAVATIIGNTIVGNTGDGVNVITGTTGLQAIIDNIITDNGGYGLNGVSAANAVPSLYNRFRDNTSGNYNSATDWLAITKLFGDVTTDTGGPETDYVNAAGNDYRLINGSPAQNMTYGQAIGAYQFKGGLILPPGFNGGRF